jgi:hypothetical protein
MSLDHQQQEMQPKDTATADKRSKAHTRHRICAGLSATQSVYIHLLFRLVLEQASKTSQLPELDGSGASDGASDASDDVRLNSLSMTKPTTVARQFQSERVVDLAINSSDDDDATHLARNTLGKLRLPRSLLEKWVEEPFFEKAVVGCFVRLGVGKSPGSRGEAQYKVPSDNHTRSLDNDHQCSFSGM